MGPVNRPATFRQSKNFGLTKEVERDHGIDKYGDEQ